MSATLRDVETKQDFLRLVEAEARSDLVAYNAELTKTIAKKAEIADEIRKIAKELISNLDVEAFCNAGAA